MKIPEEAFVSISGAKIKLKTSLSKKIEEELDVIASQKFSEYFLATKAITDFS